MFEVLPESTETCIGFKVSGKLTAEDYDALLPKLDEAISTHGKINLLMVMDDFEGYSSLEAAKNDFEFRTHQYPQVEKAAIVGDIKWQARMVKILDPFTRRTDERFFTLEQLEEGWQWIQEDE